MDVYQKPSHIIHFIVGLQSLLSIFALEPHWKTPDRHIGSVTDGKTSPLNSTLTQEILDAAVGTIVTASKISCVSVGYCSVVTFEINQANSCILTSWICQNIIKVRKKRQRNSTKSRTEYVEVGT